MTPVPHSRPTTGEAEASAVAGVLASGHHARGPVTREFERALARTTGLAHVHATSSGTTALQLALLALGAGPGRPVMVPSLTCAAVWNAVRATGAHAVLYDGDYGMPDGDELAARMESGACAVIVVAPPDRGAGIDEVEGVAPGVGGFAEFQGVPVVYDRCQQLSQDSGGEGLRARCEIFSFYATKCISTGSGGAVATADAALHECIVDLNTHDKRESYPVARHNFQFDDIRAAVGLAQLGRLAEFTAARRAHAEAYAAKLGGRGVARGDGMVFRYLLDCGGARVRAELEARLAESGIEAKQPVFRPLHRYMGLSDADFPLATHAWERMLSLPIYPTLSEGDRDRVIAAILGGAG